MQMEKLIIADDIKHVNLLLEFHFELNLRHKEDLRIGVKKIGVLLLEIITE